MIFTEIFIELLSYDISISPKKKKRKKKKSFKRIFRTSTNFQFLQWLNSFTNFPNRHRTNIKTRVCLIFESKQAYVSIFSKRKSTPFLTHTHTHTHYERMHTKSYPLSRSVVALFSPSLVLFRLVIAIYRRKSLPFCFSNSEPRVHADFYRVSSLVCLDAGSKNRSLRHLSICIYLLRGRRIFMRRERREFVRGIIFFSFVFFRLLTRLLLLFSSGDENHRSLGKLLEIL